MPQYFYGPTKMVLYQGLAWPDFSNAAHTSPWQSYAQPPADPVVEAREADPLQLPQPRAIDLSGDIFGQNKTKALSG